MFRSRMLERHCLVPASHYFEWEHKGNQKIKYSLKPAGSKWFYMAGIYRYEGDFRLPVFTILTRTPVDEIAFIHHRMPVIINDQDESIWLDTDIPAAETFFTINLKMQYGL